MSKFVSRTVSFAKQDISQIPFDELFRSFTEYSESAINEALGDDNDAYYAFLNEKANEDYANSETSFEGDLAPYEALYPQKDRVNTSEINDIAKKLACESFSEKYSLKSRPWFLPQLVAELGKWSTDFSDIAGFKALNMKTTRNRGIWLLITCHPRGLFVPDQYKEPSSSYCALVPLLLAAWKQYKNIPYSHWKNIDSLRFLVGSDLAEAMQFRVDGLSREEIIEARQHGLEIRSGVKMGELRNPRSTHKLYSTVGTCMQGMPWLSQVMLAQIWCAHPSNRNKFMVLDPNDWDNMPEPLDSSAVVKDSPKISFTPKMPSKLISVEDTWDM